MVLVLPPIYSAEVVTKRSPDKIRSDAGSLTTADVFFFIAAGTGPLRLSNGLGSIV